MTRARTKPARRDGPLADYRDFRQPYLFLIPFAVYARRRVLCLKRRAADKIGIARQFRRESHPGSFDRRILRYERLVCGALDQDVMAA